MMQLLMQCEMTPIPDRFAHLLTYGACGLNRIEVLQIDASHYADDAMVDLCERALGGDEQALEHINNLLKTATKTER